MIIIIHTVCHSKAWKDMSRGSGGSSSKKRYVRIHTSDMWGFIVESD